jgi:hypothetical protein
MSNIRHARSTLSNAGLEASAPSKVSNRTVSSQGLQDLLTTAIWLEMGAFLEPD